MRPTAFAVFLCGLSLCLVAGARAQTGNDLRPLLDRLDRLERDMNMLQRQVYRGTSPGGAPVPMSPADTQAAVNSEVGSGQIEELTYGLAQMKRRLDTLQSDIDQRLTALEHGQGGAVAAAAPAGADPRALAAAAPPKGA